MQESGFKRCLQIGGHFVFRPQCYNDLQTGSNADYISSGLGNGINNTVPPIYQYT